MAVKLVIEVIAKAAEARREFADLDKSTATIGDKLAKARGPAVAALAGIGAGAAVAVNAASDLNETVSKSEQIFGKNAGAMDKWSSGAAKNLGLSKAAALDAATSFGDMFSQIGFSGDAAAQMSKDVVGLSADLGSFNNLDTADVNDRISAAFRGEYDSLQALIPNINAARVETEAMAATGKKSAKDLTAQEKAAAVLAIVQKDGAKAAGDFARTQDGAANKSKIAKAQAADLAASLGQQLLPAYAAALEMASRFLSFLGQHQGVVTAVIVGITALASALLVASFATTIYNGAMAVKAGAGFAKSAAETARIMQLYAVDAVKAGAAAVKSAAVQVAANVRVGASWVAMRAKAVAAAAAGWVTSAVQAARSAAVQVASLARIAAAWVVLRVQAVASAAAGWAVMAAEAVKSAAIQIASLTRVAALWLIQRGAMLASVAAMAVVRGATIAYTAAQWLLNAALTANPIGIIVVAIGLLIAGLVLAWRNSETFRNVVTGAFNAVKAAAQAVWSWLKSATVAVWGFIKTYVQVQMNIVKSVFNAVKSVGLALWNRLKSGAQLAISFIKSYFVTQFNIIKAVFNAVKNVFVTGWNAIKTAAAKLWAAIKAGVTAAVNAAKGKFNDLKSLAGSVISKIKSLFSPSTLVNAGRQLISGLAAGIREKIDAAVGAVRAGVQRIKNLLPGSPIKDGPLKSWNNGGAGKRLMALLASGLRAGAGGVQRELENVLESISSPVVEPTVSLGTAGSLSSLSTATAGDTYRIDLTVQAGIGDPVAIGREVSNALDAYLSAGGRRRAA